MPERSAPGDSLSKMGNQTLREAFDYPLSKLDPFGDHIDPPSVALYETLVVKGPDGEAHPGLAESWQISEDRLTWRFRLRPNARFHSGARCDARAVIAALEGLRWGFHGGSQLWYWDPVDTVEPDGEDVLVFRLHHPYVRLPSLLWGTHTAIYNEAFRAAHPEDHGYTVADGTGPYRFHSWSEDRVVLDRWPEYPGSKAGFLQPMDNPVERIEWLSMLDPNQRVAALQAGEVDCLHGPAYDQVAELERDSALQVVRFSQASNAYLGLNWERTDLEFHDLRVRQAVSLAIDRPALVHSALDGYGQPTWGPISPNGEFYDPSVETGGARSLAQAAALLDDCGWTIGPDGVRHKDERSLRFECVIQDDTFHRRIAEGIKGQLREVGIEFQPSPVRTFQAFYAACRKGPAAFINKWLWQDPVDAALGFTATWGQPTPNWQHASVAKLDDAYREWLRAETEEALQSAASRVQLVVAGQLPYIPLLVPHDVWVHTRSLAGWEPAQAILYPFYHRTHFAK
jgi:ABC-type transport system substrate-binding protein